MPRKMRQSGVDWIGEIPEGWMICKFKHILRESNAGEVIDKSWWNVGDELLFTCQRTPMRSNFPDFPDRKRTVPGDLLLTRNATPYIFMPPAGAIYSNVVQRVTVKEKFDLSYVKYSLQCGADAKIVNGDTIPSFNMAEWGGIRLAFPELCMQKKCAQFLEVQCAEIDSIIAMLRGGIQDYKLLRQTYVFDVVTGKNLKGKKVASGQDWLGDIPAAWDVRRIVNLYREVSERGDDSLPILSVSINTGVSDKELSDEEQERVFIRSEDKTKYKRVQPGDLTYNMMRAWQGAFGAVRVNGMVSPAYVVARPKVEMDSRYVEYLLRSPNATREMQRYSRGIADFRLRLYWPEFKNIRIPCPPLEEQKRIADMLDEKCGEIDAIIADKERLIADLETYKKSLIFEVVTGKREVA